MQLIEVAHTFQLDVIHVGGPHRLPFHWSQLGFGDRQGVMLARVEVGELVDAVQHVGHELLEEDPRRDPDLAAELPRHGVGQVADIIVAAQVGDSLGCMGMLAGKCPGPCSRPGPAGRGRTPPAESVRPAGCRSERPS